MMGIVTPTLIPEEAWQGEVGNGSTRPDRSSRIDVHQTRVHSTMIRAVKTRPSASKRAM
jgi:hypothetical protein